MNKRAVGTEYEKRAGAHLKKAGYEIIACNFRCRLGEIDIIAKDGEYLVFVEVKYRRDSTEGHPLEAVTAAKQRKIRQAALCFLMERNLSPDLTEIRFDVIGILDEELTHVLGAF